MDEDKPAAMTEGPWEFASPWASYYDTALRPAREQSHITLEGLRQRNEALRVLNQLGATIYACRVADDLIKIGHSADLASRRKALKGTLLAVMFGSRDDEQAIHARLIDHRHHGREWYYPTPGVMTVVNEMRASLGMEPVAA